jgi:succinate-acetate transporter protein
VVCSKNEVHIDVQELTKILREMAIGNTFGATVLSSYGGFWISIAITFIPGGFEIMPSLEKAGGRVWGSHCCVGW